MRSSRRPQDQRLTAGVAIGALLLVGILAGFLLAGFAVDSIGKTAVQLALAVAPAVIGALVWHLQGIAAVAITAWVVPLGALSLAAAFLLGAPAGPLIGFLCIGVLALMLFSDRATRSWLSVVGRATGRRSS